MTGRRYGEGDWFAVPLGGGGFAVGVIARSSWHGVLLGYFFGPRRDELPSLAELDPLLPTDALFVGLFGHLGLKNQTWPLLGAWEDWDRSQWPMPIFARFEELTGRAFAVTYADDDPATVVAEEEVDPIDLSRLPADGVAGAGFVEAALTGLLR